MKKSSLDEYMVETALGKSVSVMASKVETYLFNGNITVSFLVGEKTIAEFFNPQGYRLRGDE